MNWIFEAYSNVYSTAMMQDHKTALHAAPAKSSLAAKLKARMFKK